MRNLIRRYNDGTASFHELVYDTEGLISALESADSDFVEDLRSQWGTLEDVYAVAIYEERKELDELDRKLIREAMNGLLRLTEGLVDSSDEGT